MSYPAQSQGRANTITTEHCVTILKRPVYSYDARILPLTPLSSSLQNSPTSISARLSYVDIFKTILRPSLRYSPTSISAILSYVHLCDTLLRPSLRDSPTSISSRRSYFNLCDTLLRWALPEFVIGLVHIDFAAINHLIFSIIWLRATKSMET